MKLCPTPKTSEHLNLSVCFQIDYQLAASRCATQASEIFTELLKPAQRLATANNPLYPSCLKIPNYPNES
jgi:hypothetical protein